MQIVVRRITGPDDHRLPRLDNKRMGDVATALLIDDRGPCQAGLAIGIQLLRRARQKHEHVGNAATLAIDNQRLVRDLESSADRVLDVSVAGLHEQCTRRDLSLQQHPALHRAHLGEYVTSPAASRQAGESRQ